MNGVQEIAGSYTLNQISQARKVAQAQGDAKTAALLSEAFDLRIDLVAAEVAQEHQAKRTGGVNVA